MSGTELPVPKLPYDPKPNTDVLDDDDDDVPQLSAHALAALHDFYEDQREVEETLEQIRIAGEDKKQILFKTDLAKFFPEDWQMSQFWYDEKTSKILAKEVLDLAGDGGRVACVSCPSIFRACQVADNVVGRTVDVFEFDKRFDAFGSSFFFYDYNDPENVPEECTGAYQVVIADPPFLAEECLEKVALTMKKLISSSGTSYMILCTGSVMESKANELLGLKRTAFVPGHTKDFLKNKFACFTNYDSKLKNLD